jgi:hypothetical protein
MCTLGDYMRRYIISWRITERKVAVVWMVIMVRHEGTGMVHCMRNRRWIK